MSTFTVGQLGRAIGPAGAVALGLLALGAIAVESLIIRPHMLRMSTEGRRVIGEVILSPRMRADPTERGVRWRTSVGVTDRELGWQVVEEFGARPVGERVPLLCVTRVRRCEIEANVAAHLAKWPVTTLNLLGGVGVAVAAAWAISLRRAPRMRRS